MGALVRQRMRLTGGGALAYVTAVTAGDPRFPALLLIHGFPSSASTFCDVIPERARVAFVVAPDLPGSGASDVPSEAAFHAFAAAVGELLERLGVGLDTSTCTTSAFLSGLRSRCRRPTTCSG